MLNQQKCDLNTYNEACDIIREYLLKISNLSQYCKTHKLSPRAAIDIKNSKDAFHPDAVIKFLNHFGLDSKKIIMFQIKK